MTPADEAREVRAERYLSANVEHIVETAILPMLAEDSERVFAALCDAARDDGLPLTQLIRRKALEVAVERAESLLEAQCDARDERILESAIAGMWKVFS